MSKSSASNDSNLVSKNLSHQKKRTENTNTYSSPIKNNKKDQVSNVRGTSSDLLPARHASTFTVKSKPCSTISKNAISNLSSEPYSDYNLPKKSNIESIVKKIAATGNNLTVSSTHPNPSSVQNKTTANLIRPSIGKKNQTANVKTVPLSNTNTALSKAIRDVPLTQLPVKNSPKSFNGNASTGSPNKRIKPPATPLLTSYLLNSTAPKSVLRGASTTAKPKPPVSPPASADPAVLIIDSDDEDMPPMIPSTGVETPRVLLEDICHQNSPTASPLIALNNTNGSGTSSILNKSTLASSSVAPASKITIDKKISRKTKIKLLEKKLETLEKKINKFAEQEVSLLDMDTEESAYIQEAKLKEEFIRDWRKYCKLIGDNPDEYVSVRKKVKVRSAPFPEINRAVERYINRTGSFPNVFDIKSVCIQANNKHNLEIKEVDLQHIAVDVFTEVGQKLQKTREKDLRATSGNALTDLALKTPDPAIQDQDLKLKLKRNKKIAKKKTEDVFNDYVRQQYDQMRAGCDDNHDSSEDEDDDGNDIEALRRKNLIENKKVKQRLIKDKTGWKEPAAKKMKRVENTTVINVTLSSQEEPVNNNNQKKIDCLVTVNASSPKYTSGSPKPQQNIVKPSAAPIMQKKESVTPGGLPATHKKSDLPKPIKRFSLSLSKPSTVSQSCAAQKPLNHGDKKSDRSISDKAISGSVSRPSQVKHSNVTLSIITSSVSTTSTSAAPISYKTPLNNTTQSTPSTLPLNKNKKVVSPFNSHLPPHSDKVEAVDFPGFCRKHAPKVHKPVHSDAKPQPPPVPQKQTAAFYESPLKRFRSLPSPVSSGTVRPAAEPKTAAGGNKRLTGVKRSVQQNQVVVIDDSDDE